MSCACLAENIDLYAHCERAIHVNRYGGVKVARLANKNIILLVKFLISDKQQIIII